jgi:hypothetical protein
MDSVIAAIPKADRVVVRHLRVREIRWVFLILFVLLSPCLVPLMLIAIFTPQGGGEDVIGWVYGLIMPVYHDIQVELVSRAGEVDAAQTIRPAAAAEGHGLVRRVLVAAAAAGRTVHEVIGTGAGGVVATWDGAHPLLHDVPDVARAQAALREQPGVTVAMETGVVTITEPHPSLGRVGAGAILLVFGWMLWVVAITSAGRQFLRHLWWDLKGVEPGRRVLGASPEGISLHIERRGTKWAEQHIPRGEIIALAHAQQQLGYTGRIARTGDCLVVVTPDAFHQLPTLDKAPRTYGAAVGEIFVAHLT